MERTKCSCKEYVVEEGSVKCAFCGHFPMDHTVSVPAQSPDMFTSLPDVDPTEENVETLACTPEHEQRESFISTTVPDEDDQENLDPLVSSSGTSGTSNALDAAKLKSLKTFLRKLFEKEDGEPYTCYNEREIICNVCNTKLNLGEVI